MDEKDWLMLKVLYKKGSITKASESLYISQPALTKRIQQLENNFNVKIISRSSKGIEFTLEGQYLVKYATDMLNTLQRTKDALTNMASNSVEGTLRIGVSKNFAFNKLPLLLKSFSKKFPNVKTQITTGYSSEMMKLFHSGSLHVAIVRGEFNWNGPKKHIETEEVCIISKEKIDINALDQIPRIEYKTDPLLKRLLDDWWKEKYDTDPLIALEVDNSQTCIEMISQGMGYGILPRYCLGKHQDLQVENVYYADGRKWLRDTWIIYHERDMALSTVREFVSFMEANIDETKKILQ